MKRAFFNGLWLIMGLGEPTNYNRDSLLCCPMPIGNFNSSGPHKFLFAIARDPSACIPWGKAVFSRLFCVKKGVICQIHVLTQVLYIFIRALVLEGRAFFNTSFGATSTIPPKRLQNTGQDNLLVQKWSFDTQGLQLQ